MMTMKNSIHNYKISIPRHRITTLLTMLKNASKLLKENTQKLAIVFSDCICELLNIDCYTERFDDIL